MGKYTMSTARRRPKYNIQWDFGSSWNDKYSGMTHPADYFAEKNIVPSLPWDWNDYRSMQEWSTKPIIGGIFDKRLKQMAYEENDRYWKDKASNYGFDLDDVSYPIRSGVYGTAVGTGDFLEASESVLGLFDRNLLKWF